MVVGMISIPSLRRPDRHQEDSVASVEQRLSIRLHRVHTNLGEYPGDFSGRRGDPNRSVGSRAARISATGTLLRGTSQ